MLEIKEISQVKTPPAEKWIGSLQKEGVLHSEMKCSTFFKEKFKLLMTSQNFILSIGEIRSKFNIYPSEFTDIGKCFNWATALYKNKKNKKLFDIQINNLLDKFKMSIRWRRAIEFFLLFGEYPEHLFPPSFNIRMVEYKTGLELQLIIYRSTTRKDIIKYWELIRKHQSLLRPLKPNKLLQKEHITFSLNPKTKKGTILPNYILNRKKSSTSSRILETQKLKKQRYKSKEIAKKFGLLEGDASVISTYDIRYKKYLEEAEFY